MKPRHDTDPGQVTGTGHRKGCPVPGDLGSGTKWVQWVLAKDEFDSKELTQPFFYD